MAFCFFSLFVIRMFIFTVIKLKKFFAPSNHFAANLFHLFTEPFLDDRWASIDLDCATWRARGQCEPQMADQCAQRSLGRPYAEVIILSFYLSTVRLHCITDTLT